MNGINNTLFIGKVLKYLEQASSTNTLALEFLSDNSKNTMITEGVVFYTHNQTAGRGQQGNKWESEAGKNIAMSIVLKPHFLEARQQFQLNKAISLAIYDVFSQITEGVSIKWANDILIGNKKVCGILIQNSLSGSRIESSVIGIGINVNQLNFDNLPHATSLKIEKNHDFDLFDLVNKVCSCVEKRYLQLKVGNFELLNSDYLSNLFRYGEEALYQYPDGNYFQGKITGISDTGKLEILTKLDFEYFEIKEIKFVF